MRNAIADCSALRKATGWTPTRRGVDFDSVVAYWRSRAAT